MFANPNSLAALQAEWDGVVRMRERMNHLVISTFAYDPIVSPAFGNVLYNLPLLLAFDVLKHVLLQAKEEGEFPLSGRRLTELMDSAQLSLDRLAGFTRGCGPPERSGAGGQAPGRQAMSTAHCRDRSPAPGMGRDLAVGTVCSVISKRKSSGGGP